MGTIVALFVGLDISAFLAAVFFFGVLGMAVFFGLHLAAGLILLIIGAIIYEVDRTPDI